MSLYNVSNIEQFQSQLKYDYSGTEICTVYDTIGNANMEIKKFAIKCTNSIDIDFVSTNQNIKGYSFKIIAKIVELDFSIEIDKYNRAFNWAFYYNRHFRKSENGKTIIVEKNDSQLIGISVGDLLKHYYYTQPVFDNSLNKKIENSEELKILNNESESELETEIKIDKILKKSLNIDSATVDFRDMFGYCPLYSNKIYLWDLIAYPNFISKLTPNFVSFCKKIIYFPVKNSLFRIIKNNDQVEIKTHPTKCKQFLNTITNKSLITKLCKYYLYGDDPEITNLQYRFSFVEPISVPDCLLYMYSKTEDQKYMRIYSALNVKLNKTEEMVLEKFSPLVLNDIHKIDKAYPYFALRKIYIYSWYNNRISYTNDMVNLHNDLHDHELQKYNPVINSHLIQHLT